MPHDGRCVSCQRLAHLQLAPQHREQPHAPAAAASIRGRARRVAAVGGRGGGGGAGERGGHRGGKDVEGQLVEVLRRHACITQRAWACGAVRGLHNTLTGGMKVVMQMRRASQRTQWIWAACAPQPASTLRKGAHPCAAEGAASWRPGPRLSPPPAAPPLQPKASGTHRASTGTRLATPHSQGQRGDTAPATHLT